MKKTTIFAVVMVFFFLSMLIPLSSDARGRGGVGRTRSTTVIKKEVVFHVSPQQFRKALKIFSKKCPGYKCDGWDYDFDSQHYSNDCTKGEENIFLILLMDGSIMTHKISKDYSTATDKKIGLWE